MGHFAIKWAEMVAATPHLLGEWPTLFGAFMPGAAPKSFVSSFGLLRLAEGT